MIQTAENVAAKHDISTAERHEVVLRRGEQYRAALAGGAAFLKRFMTQPFEVPVPNFKKTANTLEGDEDAGQSSVEGLAKLRPVQPNGTVTFGGQTHPADGNAGIVVASEGKARELSQNPKIAVRLLGFGQARAPLAYMPEATVPAARQALERAGLAIGDLAAIKTHNPFALNDIYFARQTGADLGKMNNYGSTLVWGHRMPMGTRAVIELIEELRCAGGRGLFTGRRETARWPWCSKSATSDRKTHRWAGRTEDGTTSAGPSPTSSSGAMMSNRACTRCLTPSDPSIAVVQGSEMPPRNSRAGPPPFVRSIDVIVHGTTVTTNATLTRTGAKSGLITTGACAMRSDAPRCASSTTTATPT